MKKLLVLVVALIISVTTAMAGDWYKLPEINIKPENGSWSGWQKCTPGPIDILFEYEKKQITIYSQNVQVINYITLEKTSHNGYYTLAGDATDTHYKRMFLILYFYDNNSVFLHIVYSDGEYMYVVQ